MILLASCGGINDIEPVTEVTVRTVEVKRPAPLIPDITPLKLRGVSWIVITENNVEEAFSKLDSEKVLFALSVDDYENLSLNISDIRSFIEKQKEIIIIYGNQFE